MNSEVYNDAIEVLERFISLIKETNSTHGMTYNFSTRKADIHYGTKNKGIMIRKDAVYVINNSLMNKGKLVRVRNSSEEFQMSCTGEYVCDKAMEDLMYEAFKLHTDLLRRSLLLDEWIDE